MVKFSLKCSLLHLVLLPLLICAILKSEGEEESDDGKRESSLLNEIEKSLKKQIDFGISTLEADEQMIAFKSRRRRNLNNGGAYQNDKKTKTKKRESRKKIAISAVEKIVEEKLKEHLRPLETALKIIRLDSFTEAILRQLSSLELIQSKLLTEYGELKAAVSEVGRHTLDLGRQVAGLDERLASLDRQLPHRMDISALRKDFRSDSSARPTKSYSDVSQTTEMVKDALVAITSKITGCERRFKDDFSLLANRTIEAVKTSQNFLDRRLSELATQTQQISLSFDKFSNESSCSPSNSLTSNNRPSQNSDRFFRQSHKSSPSSPEASRDDLVYLPAEERSLNQGRLEREERQHPPVISPFTGWVRPVTPTSEVQSLNQGSISRLASQIAKQVAIDAEIGSARDCSDIGSKEERKNGIYTIYPASCSKRYAVKVWCEFDSSTSSSSDGWTVIQRRGPWDESSLQPPSSPSTSPFSDFTLSSTPPVDFYRDWADYKWGFGNLAGEYWLGNEYIHEISRSGDYVLRIELYDWGDEMRWAQYDHFSIEDEPHNYTLRIGEYTGNSGNSLKHHQGAAFSTRDRDNDSNPRGHCARTFHGAWWFMSCHESHLNGRYHKGRHKIYGDGINWLAFRGHNYSLKRSRMMIKPSNTHLN